MASERILVIGGTGYIGSSLVEKLIENEYDITLFVRDRYRIKNKNSETKIKKYFIGDLLDKQTLTKIKNYDLIINLASIVRTINKEKYNENIISLKNLIDVMKNNKIPKIIYFSSQNVLLKNKGYYGKSKEECENIIKNSNLEYIIIRPNNVYGIDKNNDFYRMANIIAHFHIIPIIGTGDYKIQPILKEDLINTTINILKNFKDFKYKDSKNGSIIEISGNTVSFNEIVELIGKYMKINPIKLHIPIKLLRISERFIPFDVFDEDKISDSPFGYASPFEENMKKIVNLI